MNERQREGERERSVIIPGFSLLIVKSTNSLTRSTNIIYVDVDNIDTRPE